MSSIKLKHSGGNSVSLNPPTNAPTSSEVAFKLPTADGSAGQFMKTDGSGNLAFAAAGISEFDQWYLSADKTSNGDLDSNLSRNNFTANASPLGTGMTESSGVFTFPSTGKWVVLVQCTFNLAGNDNVVLYIKVTTNNSTYTTVNMLVDGQTGSASENKHGGTMGLAFIDVTDTSQVKVKFTAGSIGTGSNVHGRSDMVVTGFNFIRIGDT